MVQKVSGLVSAGTTETQGSSDMRGAALVSRNYSIPLVGSSTNRADTRSQLVRQLAPPTEPVRTVVLGAGFFVVVGVVALLGLTAMVAGISNQAVGGLCVGTITLVVVAVVYAVLTTSQKNYDEQYKKQHAAWSHAMHVWNGLYYCQRDDGIFWPGRSLVPPANMTYVLNS
jgi:hypothetical protein